MSDTTVPAAYAADTDRVPVGLTGGHRDRYLKPRTLTAPNLSVPLRRLRPPRLPLLPARHRRDPLNAILLRTLDGRPPRYSKDGSSRSPRLAAQECSVNAAVRRQACARPLSKHP